MKLKTSILIFNYFHFVFFNLLKENNSINIDLINKEVNWIIQEILRENKTKGENLIKTSYNNPPLSIIVH